MSYFLNVCDRSQKAIAPAVSGVDTYFIYTLFYCCLLFSFFTIFYYFLLFFTILLLLLLLYFTYFLYREGPVSFVKCLLRSPTWK